MTHGTYSATPTTDVNGLMAETAAFTDVLENSDRDLLAIKGSLLFLLGELDRHAPAVDRVAAELEHLETQAAELDGLTPKIALQLARQLAQTRNPVQKMLRLTSQIADTATKSVTAHKLRAETSAKLAETRGVHVAVQLIQVARQIVHGLSDDANLRDSYELALRREIYGPLRLEPPDVSTAPELI